MTVETWLWIGVIGMGFGSILLFLPTLKNKSVSEEGDSIAHFIVPLIALTLYLLMALGHGSVLLPSGRTFYFGRFIDWSITTPILLLSLVYGAEKGHSVKRVALMAGLAGLDVYMIVTGLVAGWTSDPELKWEFYVLSCLAFVGIYGLLWGPFKRLAMATPEGSDYVKKATVLSVIWFFYPVVFIIGQEGLRLWSPLVDAVLFTSLDLIAKVAYGLWAVSLAGKRDPAQQTISVGGSTRLATGH